MGGGEFWVYQMPDDLRPYVPGTVATREAPPPWLFMIPPNEAYPVRRDYMCRTELHGLSLPGPSFCVDVVGDLEEDDHDIATLARFNIPNDIFATESADQTTSHNSRSLVPILIHSVEERNGYFPAGPEWTSSSCAHNRLVHNVKYSDLNELMGVVAHLTATDSNLGVGRWGNLWKCNLIGRVVEYDICLISGRLCVATTDEIYVVDYVRPLT
jgi:hypothetical protein